MNATDLLDRLTARGILLRAVDDRIQAKPMSLLLPDERGQLQQLKAELVILLRGDEPVTEQLEHPEQLDEVLDDDERQRLMAETADRIRRQCQGQAIDWRKADTINTKIGQTFSRHKLTKLLHDYAVALTFEPCD